MDSDDSSSDRGPNSPSLQALGLYTAPLLNDHVPQLPYTPTPPYAASPTNLPTHPFDLNFPTLNDDGSVPDLTAHQSRRLHSPTPPAALSSLGARVRMNEEEHIDEYDMLDDLSEVSDGHDTASIPSNGGDTPDDSQSETGVEESTILSFVNLNNKSESSETTPSAPKSFSEMKAENDLIDSYMPDDLETPRQSTITSSSPNWKAINHILFVSEQDDSRKPAMDDICSFVASHMNKAALHEQSTYKVVRMPATPSGIRLPSAHVVRGQGSVSATIQHCIGADSHMAKSYKLRVLDQDEENSSFFTVEDAKVDLPRPDIAIFFADLNEEPPTWFVEATKAVKSLNVPTLVVFDSDSGVHSSKRVKKLLRESTKSMMSISLDDLYEKHNSDTLAPLITSLMSHSAPSSTAPALKATQTLGALLRDYWFVIFQLVGLLAMFYLRYTQFDPVADLAARRDGLTMAWTAATNSSPVSKTFDVEQLLPESQFKCGSGPLCESLWLLEGMPPNHLVVSSPGQPGFFWGSGLAFPNVASARVYKANGRQLAFNQTSLIKGVYDYTFDIDEAYGEVYIDLDVDGPERVVTFKHDFGSRMLQRRTYEKVGIEAGKEVSKDVAFMRQKARSLSEKIPLTIGAGVWATKNVTSLIALHLVRDLQVVGHTAVSIFSKAAQVSNNTATNLSKDIVHLQSDLVKFTTEVSTMVKSRVESATNFSKALIRKPIEVSRGRLQSLKKASGFGKGQDRNDCHYECSETDKAMSAVDEPGKAVVKEEPRKYLSVPSDHDAAVQATETAYKQQREDWKKEGYLTKSQKLKVEEIKKKMQAATDGLKSTKKEARKMKKEAKKQQRRHLYG